jgi:hypothetical protein
MLHRDDAAGLVVITQPAHAWVAGQLARAWGTARFPRPEPREEVCVAAERHDDGWLAWEAAPTLNPATGRPFSFLELPRAEHLAIWSKAGPTVLALGRYPALLVSLHGTGLYERHDPAQGPTDPAVQAFLDQEQALQTRLLTELQSDPDFAVHAAPEAIARNRRLIAVWDALSLAICGGQRDPRRIGGVPTVEGETVLSMLPESRDPARVAIAPWPFAEEIVTLHFEGRHLPERFADEATLRAVLAQSPWVSFAVRLTPARGVDVPFATESVG